MKDLRPLLEEADPVRSEPGLSAAEAARMRGDVLRSAGAAHVRRRYSPSALALAAALILMVAAGAIVGRRSPGAVPAGAPDPLMNPAAASERRQLQFATPGGTRVIWTLDPHFDLREVVP